MADDNQDRQRDGQERVRDIAEPLTPPPPYLDYPIDNHGIGPGIVLGTDKKLHVLADLIGSFPWHSHPDGSNSPPSRWYAWSASFDLVAGAAADQQLVAAVAGKKIEAMVLYWGALGDAMAAGNMLATFQDSADVAVTPATARGNRTLVLSRSDINYGEFSTWFITTVAGRALEVDITGGGGTESIILAGIYRLV